MKCIKISNKPITARHLTSSSTSSIGQNACNKTGHEPMFRSINHTDFLTKIHEIKCKLKLAYHTTWCNLNQTQRSSIDQEIKSQKLEKLTVNIKVMNTISTILLEPKLKYTSILVIGQLATQWTWFTSSIQAETHKSKFKKLTWMWK